MKSPPVFRSFHIKCVDWFHFFQLVSCVRLNAMHTVFSLWNSENQLRQASSEAIQLCAEETEFPGIYVFHTWSFCAGRKTSTLGLFELCIIIICWIFCAYTQILNRDVEVFCVHTQKFLIVILDNKVFQRWIICAYTQILNRDVEVFCVHAQKLLNY